MRASKQRIALFASAYQGTEILNRLLCDDRLSQTTQVVGVVRDDPSNPVCKASIRTWKYLDQTELPKRVERLARANGIPVYSGALSNERFFQDFISAWQPDLSICCVFGQKITARYRNVAGLGTLNLHPCCMSPFELWPSEYSGVLPIKRMLGAGHTGLFWAAHFMTDVMDAGPPIAFSRWMPINAEMSLAQNHEGHAPEIAKFVSDVTQVLTGVSEPADVAPPIGYADFGQLRNEVLSKVVFLNE